MKYSLASLLLILSLAVWAQPADDEVSAARAEMSELYSILDTAFEEQISEDMLRAGLPDATVILGSFEITYPEMLEQMKQLLEGGGAARQRTTITSLTLVGSEATVTRVSEGTITIRGQTRTGSDVAEDTWVRTPDGWRLKTSVVLGSGEIVPPTTPERAEE